MPSSERAYRVEVEDSSHDKAPLAFRIVKLFTARQSSFIGVDLNMKSRCSGYQSKHNAYQGALRHLRGLSSIGFGMGKH